MRDHLRLYFGMCMQVIVDSIRKGNTQFFQPIRCLAICFLGFLRSHVQLCAQVRIQFLLPFQLCQSPQGPKVIAFYSSEIILALRIKQSKNHIRIGRAIDMWNPKIIANNLYLFCLRFPAIFILLLRMRS